MNRALSLMLLLACPAWAADLPTPVTDADYTAIDRAQAELGQLLYYDPILSGNRNIACATCHHPRFGTSDGLSLGLGEGAIGLGPDRHVGATDVPEQRIPRNAPGLFNLGAKEFTILFDDGRIEADPSRPSGIRSPLEDDMMTGFSGVLSAQTMFPVLAQDEMAGNVSENDVSKLARQGRITGPGGAWETIAKRVEAIPEYRRLFDAAFPDIAAGRPIAFTDIANVLAAFMAFEWRSDTSPFDATLRGEGALTGDAATGMELFYGKAGCSTCHSGPFQSDQKFHAMGVPQIGPGKHERFESTAADEGRMRVSNRPEDAYAFRTPSLRNVMATGPYGHDGAYRSLRDFVVAHLDPANAMATYDRNQAVLPDLPNAQDWNALISAEDVAAIVAAVKQPAIALSGDEVTQILAFLESLSDPAALTGRLGVPVSVPSGLPVDR